MKQIPEYGIQDIDMLIADRKKFEEFVYTPIDTAIFELKKRCGDPELEKTINSYLTNGIPQCFTKNHNAVLVRHLITPNYETERFLNIANGAGLNPVLVEYTGDKFTSNNELKYALGRLSFYLGKNKNNESYIRTKKIIDFDRCNGKKMSENKTLWGQNFVDFHHELFLMGHSIFKTSDFYDISDWLNLHASSADGYYKYYLALFTQTSILFENFLLDSKNESDFVRKIFLPAFIKVYNQCGIKPLIVALESTKTEGDIFWLSYSGDVERLVKNRLANKK